MVKSILKWQGGKSSLFYGDIGKKLPPELFDASKDITFIDAMAGGGSVFLYVLQNCPGVKRLLINDINFRLIDLYFTIKVDVETLIAKAKQLEDEHNSAPDKRVYYNSVRDSYNSLDIWNNSYQERSAMTLYLNRAGYNGVYRENSSGDYNVPWGQRDIIKVVYEDELRETSRLMNSSGIEVKFNCGHYNDVELFILGDTFVYFDPPYRPLTSVSTKSFTDYTKSTFNDDSQINLKNYCDYITNRYKTMVMVSNSYDPNSNFIIDLYQGYNICQIDATRSSGGKNAMRGTVKENLITNY